MRTASSRFSPLWAESPVRAREAELAARKDLPIPSKFLVMQPTERRGMAHLVRATSFKDLALKVHAGEVHYTLCDRTRVTPTWEFVPKDPKTLALVTCARCRSLA